MANVFSNAFSGSGFGDSIGAGGGLSSNQASAPSTFLSSSVLGNESAQNSVQTATQVSNNMSGAYNAVSNLFGGTSPSSISPSSSAMGVGFGKPMYFKLPMPKYSIASSPQNYTSGQQTSTANVAKFGEKPREATEFETHLAQIRGQKGETMGNADDRARWEAQAYKAKAMSEAQAAQDAKDQEQKKLMEDERKRAIARQSLLAETSNTGKK
jgi:hypothetical protein